MKLSTKFDYSSVAYNVDNTVHLLVQATAPKLDLEKNRVPLNLVATLDVSPSMYGAKIEYARKSLMKLIDHLSPNDTLGLVSFDSDVRTLAPVTKMDQKAKDNLKQIVQKTGIGGGGTNLSGAMLESIRHANQIDGASRVILFTDGQPNVGVREPDKLSDLLRQNMRKNLSLTSFGYGNDHDANLLTALAEIGKGNYAYLQNPDDALTAFARELGGLLSCYGQNLKFAITPKEKTEILEVMSDVDVEEIPEGGVLVSVADLYSEETRNIVLKVKLDRQPKSHPRATSVAEVVLKYDRMPEGKRQTEDVRAKIQFVKVQDVQKNADQEVVDQVGLCQLMKAQEEATVYAASGNLSMANSVLNSTTLGVQGVFGAAGPQGASGLVGAAMATTQGYYADQASFTNSVHLRAASAHSHSTGRGSHTSNMGLYTTNTAMASMVDAFKADDDQLNDALNSHNHSLGSAGAPGISSHTHNPGLASGTITGGQGMSGIGAIQLDQSRIGGGFNNSIGSTTGTLVLNNGIGGGGIVHCADSTVTVQPAETKVTESKASKTKSRSKKEW
jgi:Ca-activated chloride channel family protein